MARIKHLHNHTDPDDLLPDDQYLIAENLDTVASWTVTRRQIWTAEFEASFSSTTGSYTETETTLPLNRNRRGKKRRKGGKTRNRDKPQDTSRPRDPASSLIDTTAEGSQQHKRRKKKRMKE
ncbi:hypothetical protein THAOC_36919 [Thalassiosira oceanica]|uniref:Uncharacterized protein n=1 Tax=Thalassiosira oceanica TaxID=159749 RepID=K0R113_THAOC|nr:hypothetical protein THAOC_36919 [Thalassiosira oceanica]|eukprot:EJK44529.1 hypothetical protein THAOC_36919 [Thalassiosira oceanica]